MKVATAREMRAIEEEAASGGLSTAELIERAGRAVADAAAGLAPEGSILILVGPGNNGADGVTAAELLRVRGRDVTVVTFKRDNPSPFRGHVLRSEDSTADGTFRNAVSAATLLVDALLGTGQNRAPDGALTQLLETANDSRSSASVALAVDLPTGVDADSGAVRGAAFRAGFTLCLGCVKRGAVLSPGAQQAGVVLVAEVGIPPSLTENLPVETFDDNEIAELLPVRSAAGNKGSSGRLLFVGGSRDFVGAAALASMAAYRVGAGLVEIAIPESIQFGIAAHALEPIYCLLPESDGYLTARGAEAVRDRIEKTKAIVFGCGMGLTDDTIAFTRAMLTMVAETKIPAVFDADALNALSQIEKWWETGAQLVITPHPGEMARLTQLSIDDVQRDRLETARHWAKLWGQTVVLKGSGTIVATRDGHCVINQTGSANLATAGTGDVLSGIIGGLLAQGCSRRDSAVVGAYLHGRAGDLLMSQYGDVGMIASDLHTAIPAARRSVLFGIEANE